MANINDIFIQKARKQREDIKKLLAEGTSAILEMPNHDIPYPINIKWLEAHNIKVTKTEDRDGRPIAFLDTSRVMELSDRFIQAYISEGMQISGESR